MQMQFTANPAIQIDALITSGKLWVRNTTNPRRVILLAIIDRAGRTTSHPIPDTPHPIYLSNDIAPDILATCQDLRRFMQSGALSIVLPEEAERYYQQKPQAIDAVKRAYDKVSNRNDPVSREALASADPNSRAPEAPTTEPPTTEIGTRYDSAGINMMVRGIVGNVESGQLKAKDAIADLDNITVTEADLVYISGNSKGALREWAKKALAESRSQSE